MVDYIDHDSPVHLRPSQGRAHRHTGRTSQRRSARRRFIPRSSIESDSYSCLISAMYLLVITYNILPVESEQALQAAVTASRRIREAERWHGAESKTLPAILSNEK